MIPLLDVSFYNKIDDAESYYNGIGLAILIAERSTYENRIMIIDNKPTWINILNDKNNNTNIIAIVENIVNVSDSTTFRLDKAIDMISYSAKMSGNSTQNMSLVLLSNQCSQLSYNTIVSLDVGSIILWNLSNSENIYDIDSHADTSGLILLSGFSNCIYDYFKILMTMSYSRSYYGHYSHNHNLYTTPYNTICQILENPKYNLLGDYLQTIMQ